MFKRFTTQLLLVSFFSLNVSAKTNMIPDLNISKNIAQDYIDSGDENWNNFKIVNHKNIYDGNLNFYGYAFELINANKEGYAIVTNNNGNYTVVEASSNSSSPYKNLVNNKAIYASPLEYYSLVEDEMERGLNGKIVDLETGNIYQLNDLSQKSFISNNQVTYNLKRSEYHKIFS